MINQIRKLDLCKSQRLNFLKTAYPFWAPSLSYQESAKDNIEKPKESIISLCDISFIFTFLFTFSFSF